MWSNQIKTVFAVMSSWLALHGIQMVQALRSKDPRGGGVKDYLEVSANRNIDVRIAS